MRTLPDKESELRETLPDGRVRCLACARRCAIAPGGRGACFARHNDGGRLLVPFGYVSGAACDPVEKKPFFHVLPGSGAFSFGMLGCNFRCPFCQNYDISQPSPDEEPDIRLASPEEICAAAGRCKARLVVSTYNEPLVSIEWARAVFERARGEGFLCAFVSNGYATPEAVEFIKPVINACKVDLKCFDAQKHLKATGGELAPVLDTIRRLKENGIWVEVVTLVIPGFNDSKLELAKTAEFIVSVSADIPWHVTAFHPDYQMTDAEPTPPETLELAASVGVKKGLKYVYAGNLPDSPRSNTLCHKCGELLVGRNGFSVINRLRPGGVCPKCGGILPGIF